MALFFTADTHFSSQRHLKYSRRPFKDVTEMNYRLISNWNETVKEEDTVYHLGDIGDIGCLRLLNGNIIILPGNYETPQVLSGLNDRYKIIRPNHRVSLEYDGITYQVYLVHKPEEANSMYNAFFLFGHIHKLQMVKRNGLNVGVDCHNFYPISIETIVFYMMTIKNYYDQNVFMEMCKEGIK